MNISSKSKSKRTFKFQKVKAMKSNMPLKLTASSVAALGAGRAKSRAAPPRPPGPPLTAPTFAPPPPPPPVAGSAAATSSSASSSPASPTQGAPAAAMTTPPTLQMVPVSTPAPIMTSPPLAKPTPSLWFTVEIQQMMHGFGDSRKPLTETAALIEEIVHKQIASLLYQAEDVGRQRNARFLGIEDFLFLLRKDKVKLRRLLRFMMLKDVKSHMMKGTGLEDEDAADGDIKQPLKKRKKICYDFLSAIDQTGELVALFDDDCTDEVKHERALRAELQSRTLDAQQYMEFCEARQASFTPRYKTQKFKDWMMEGMSLDIKPNPLAMEVLGYFAYEIVSQIVDLALLVRQDQRGHVDDPLSQGLPGACLSHDPVPSLTASPQHTILSPAPAPTVATVTAALKSPTGIGESIKTVPSPVNSPPATPTNPSHGLLSLGQSSSQGLGQSIGSSSSKSKTKKKKKGMQSSRDLFTSQAITPADVREAMQRYGQAIGPFANYSKSPSFSPTHWILCC